ncbi:hypothetical protein BD779DRAFT_1678822 [Infundibulicybe gibba]|nr:hypothetical protein BD779DRAFT_1678822 [Infundibulicybe gibba]
MSTPDPSETDVHEVISAVRMCSKTRKDKQNTVLDPYFGAARWFPLYLDPFTPLIMVFHANNDDSDSTLGSDKGLDKETRKYHLELFDNFMSLVPGFLDLIISLQDHTDALQSFISQLSAAAGEARSEDTNSIKTNTPLYLLVDPQQDVLQPPIPKDCKDSRGFNHAVTAQMLCPMRLIKKFDRDPQLFMERVKDGQIKIRALDYASWMYDTDMYDPEEIDRGLLRGYFLLRVYRHIFTGPATATSLKHPGSKKSKGIIHHLAYPTPRTIAYAAIQARLALSAAPKWGIVDSDFNLETLFFTIVDLFEDDPKDEWAVSMLEWWRIQVPRLSENAKRTVDEMTEHEYNESDVNVLREQRAARRQCLLEEGTPPQDGQTSESDTGFNNPPTNSREPTPSSSDPPYG